jgi:hypothetical protein
LAEFFKKNQEEAAKANEWLNQFRPNFESAIERIEKYQERQLLNIQVVALAIVGAFLINLLTTSLFDLSFGNSARVILDILIVISTLSTLSGIFLYFRNWMLKYQPKKPVLTLWIKPEDTKPFLSEDYFKAMMDFLDQGKLKNFKLFGESLFENLKMVFPHIFGRDCNVNPIEEHEQMIDSNRKKPHKEFVSMSKDYDLSNLKAGGVKFKLKVSLIPHAIYRTVTDNEGVTHDESAIYTFYLAYSITIENPKHYHAKEALENYYHFYATSLIHFTVFPIANAFKNVDKAFFDKL